MATVIVARRDTQHFFTPLGLTGLYTDRIPKLRVELLFHKKHVIVL